MSTLDDFFAKKDRKKSTTKTNLLAADELYRTLEETTKPPQEVDSCEKLQLEQATSNQSTTLEFGIRFSDDAADEEDEWCDFTDEYDQPFPGLRRHSKLLLSPGYGVPVMPSTNKEGKMGVELCPYQDTGGDGFGVGPGCDELDKPTCPWLKVEPNELTNSGAKANDPSAMSESPSSSLSQSQRKSLLLSPTESPSKSQPSSQSQPKPQDKTSSTPKKQVYVPPALRQSQCEFRARSRKPTPPKLAKGQAPDLNNVDFFPSLCQSRLSKRAK